MKRIMLVCNAGMSTGILAKKIQEASNGEYEVFAFGEAEYLDHLENTDLILVGPQIRHLLPNIRKAVAIPVEVIAPVKYGLMDGKGVCQDIKNIFKEDL
ncbi:MAG: PTS sugar transporter subunit IIB [Erysipelotrichaceae bacterium]